MSFNYSMKEMCVIIYYSKSSNTQTIGISRSKSAGEAHAHRIHIELHQQLNVKTRSGKREDTVLRRGHDLVSSV